MKIPFNIKLHAPLAVALALACVACGAKEDYSGTNELSKVQNQSAAAPSKNGASPQRHAALPMVNQQRPPNSGG